MDAWRRDMSIPGIEDIVGLAVLMEIYPQERRFLGK